MLADNNGHWLGAVRQPRYGVNWRRRDHLSVVLRITAVHCEHCSMFSLDSRLLTAMCGAQWSRWLERLDVDICHISVTVGLIQQFRETRQRVSALNGSLTRR